MKRCSKCDTNKKTVDFYRQTRRSDGLHPWCKECCRQHQRETAARRRENERRRYWDDPEAARERQRKWASTRREEIAARVRESYRRNGGAEAARRRRLQNPEPYRRAVRRWYSRNREYAIERQRVRDYGIQDGSVSREALATLRALPCTYCGADGPSEIDHVVPLVKGGPHALDNLTPACRTCNASKGGRLLSEWSGPAEVNI